MQLPAQLRQRVPRHFVRQQQVQQRRAAREEVQRTQQRMSRGGRRRARHSAARGVCCQRTTLPAEEFQLDICWACRTLCLLPSLLSWRQGSKHLIINGKRGLHSCRRAASEPPQHKLEGRCCRYESSLAGRQPGRRLHGCSCWPFCNVGCRLPLLVHQGKQVVLEASLGCNHVVRMEGRAAATATRLAHSTAAAQPGQLPRCRRRCCIRGSGHRGQQ